MKPPRDFEKAVEGYRAFTTFEPREIGTFKGLRIPKRLHCAGQAVCVYYRSDKWEAKYHNYKHDHDPGTKVYLPDGDGPLVDVPAGGRPQSLYLIGECLGFEFGKLEAEISRPYPYLYATPDKRHLLVIDLSQASAVVEAMIWGPKLIVTPDGIDG